MSLSWLDLAAKFKELEDDLPFTRVDAHWGGGDGEQWQLAGPSDSAPKQRLETVARLAGNKLLGELGNHPDFPKVLKKESDPVVRWYKAIWKLVGGLRFDYRDQAQDSGGPTTAGKIQKVVKASISTCMTIHAEFIESQSTSPPPAPARAGLLDSMKSLFGKRK
jgi:hypothetical protein